MAGATPLKRDCPLLPKRLAANSLAITDGVRPHTNMILCLSVLVARFLSFMARSIDNGKQMAR